MAEIQFPPVGIAHLTGHPLDLLRSRVTDTVEHIDVACVSQPKTEPHLGTVVLIYTAFAFAAEARQAFGRPVRVVLDILENSPGREWTVDGRRYFLPLSHVRTGDETVAELATRPLRDICVDLEQRSQVPHATRSYAVIQQQPPFRSGLAAILTASDTFGSILAPRDGRILVRPLCRRCGIGDKDGSTVTWSPTREPTTIYAECPEHGRFAANIDDADVVIDCNAPVRTVLRSYSFVASDAVNGRLTLLINGADWAGEWMQHVYLAGLEALGVAVRDTPPNFFAPLIVDESGAKLSKTIYLRPGVYDHLPSAWRSYEAFCEHYGARGRAQLWDEVRRWVSEPRRFFRNYSLAYLESLFD